jgi:6-phosphofructokinase 1
VVPFNPLEDSGFINSALSTLQEIDGLVVIGGNGSLHIAYYFQKVWGKVVFIPKTIDNDIWGTESIGFDNYIQLLNPKRGFLWSRLWGGIRVG